MSVAIAGIGLATAQGSTAEILESKVPHPPAELPWTPNKWNVSRICYPALESSLSGAARWRVLIEKAFADLGEPVHDTPLLVASCNGDASQDWEQAFDTTALLEDTPWANERLPVFSSSCASGIHALYAARHLLTSGVADQVFVLAADIISQSNHENFESLRVLAEKPGPPWQSASQGFILGEAAVVLKLIRSENHIQLTGPELASDFADRDGLSSVLEALSPRDSSLILGQGTGPFQNDTAELFAFSAHINKDTPLATPLSYFGHTLGASGLLA
ncbi:MAG TPA: beta-ketoacyl synthase N-terminal-like domain-containing protein, partial [Pyrinomonadaceae bacterium]|nr:beta-ketoacyl synthase N-terminal-like domain-containing protein [Pyrinomonadaceae bacterium]